MVAHDLRSPLAVLAFGTAVVAEHADRKLAALADRMKRAVTTMQVLISDLLDLEQSNADVLRIEPGPVSSGDLVAARSMPTLRSQTQPESFFVQPWSWRSTTTSTAAAFIRCLRI